MSDLILSCPHCGRLLVQGESVGHAPVKCTACEQVVNVTQAIQGLRLTHYNNAVAETVLWLGCIIAAPFFLVATLGGRTSIGIVEVFEIAFVLVMFSMAIYFLLSITFAITLSARITVQTLFGRKSYGLDEVAAIQLRDVDSEKIPGIRYQFAHFHFLPRKIQSPCKVKLDSYRLQDLLTLLQTSRRDHLLRQPSVSKPRVAKATALFILVLAFFGAGIGWRIGRAYIVQGCVAGAAVGAVLVTWDRIASRNRTAPNGDDRDR